MDYSTWKHLNNNGYRPVEYIYKPDNFSNPNFGLGIIAYGNKYGLEVKMQASQEDIDYAMSGHQLHICGCQGTVWNDNLPYQNVCTVYIRQNSGYYLGRQENRGWYTKPDGTITNNSGAIPLIKPCDTDIHIVSTYYDSESDIVKTFLDGVLKSNLGSKAWENDLTAGTEYFVYGLNNSSVYTFKGRIYYIKTFDDERNVTGHFIPCVRKSDGKVGLYDVVNDVFKVPTYDYIKAGPYTGQRLPYDYKEVEYIKNNSSSGGLDTGMKMSITDYTVEAKFKQDEISNGMVLGTYNNDAGCLWLYNQAAGNHNEFAVASNYNNVWKVRKELWRPCDTNIHIVRFEGHSTGCNISWDSGNTTVGTYTTPQQYSTDNLFVFGRGAAQTTYLGKIYYVKLWNTETGAMLLDYVPCIRMSDNTPGFYDLVSDTFKTITDAATKWGAGPDIITEQIPWTTGTGNIRLMYTGVGNGTIIAESDETNLYEARSAQFTVMTTDGSNIERTITISQAAKERIDISNAVVTAANQTYSGSALTPTPTVTLNGETITSSGYDVAYSDNTNAGTATITVTGKGAYTGVTVGTFAIAKANPVYVAPTANNRTYNTSSAALLNAGSSTTAGSFTYCDTQSGTYSSTIPSQTNAGTYTTWWKFTPTDTTNYNSIGETSVSTTISAKTVSSPTITLSQSTYTYSGSAYTPTATVKDGSTTISSSEYTVSYSNNTNAGTATVTITDKSGGNYTVSGSTTFTINKATPTYTAPTAITGLTYSGSSQYLVTAGSTSHGTIQYSSDGTTWSTTIPSSTNAGSYTTYWRLVGDSNHNDVASTSLSTTIAKASRTLSFADSYVVLNTSSNVTKTATPSAGSGDGTITYSISSTTYATINSSSGEVTSKTSDGSAVVTATIAEGTNYLSASASYTLYVFATTHNYYYTGSAQNVELPAGQYKLQCWGAQGGTCSSGYSGGKGGYSEGVLTLTSPTTVYIFVGGKGSSSGNGGWNGGGGGSGSSSYSSGNEYGSSTFGCGGGATDIALVTSSMSYSSYRNNRSSASLLSRMIVAGGGSGGAYGYQEVTTPTTSWENLSVSFSSNWKYNGQYVLDIGVSGWSVGDTIRIINSNNNSGANDGTKISINRNSSFVTGSTGDTLTWDITSGTTKVEVLVWDTTSYDTMSVSNVQIQKQVSSTSTTTDSDSKAGYVGGGTNGGGYSSSYYGKQNGAGSNGSFGLGANQTVTNYRYGAGCGGGGWYGGGNAYSDSGLSTIRCSGGGSGFVNTAANAQYRPSGYTGLQLDSGETKAGNTSFPNTAGTGNETGHSGNGYAKITRIS